MNEKCLLTDEQCLLLFEHLAEEVHFWRIIRDDEGRIKTWCLLYVNPPTLKTWGRASADEIIGKTTEEIFGPGATEHYMPVVSKVMSEGRAYSYQDYFPHLDKHFRFTTVPFDDCFITTGTDITELVKDRDSILVDNQRLQIRDRDRTAELEATVARLQLALEEAEKLRQELHNLAIRDPLTNLFNRRFMEISLERELIRAQRSRYPVALILFDIDYFKTINDRFGHAAGDTVLREVSEFILRNSRGADVACRYGGDELVLILPEASLSDAVQRVEHIRHEVRQRQWEFEGTPLTNLTLSLGVAEFPLHGITGVDLLKAADDALYLAKQGGRDRIVAAG